MGKYNLVKPVTQKQMRILKKLSLFCLATAKTFIFSKKLLENKNYQNVQCQPLYPTVHFLIILFS